MQSVPVIYEKKSHFIFEPNKHDDKYLTIMFDRTILIEQNALNALKIITGKLFTEFVRQ